MIYLNGIVLYIQHEAETGADIEALTVAMYIQDYIQLTCCSRGPEPHRADQACRDVEGGVCWVGCTQPSEDADSDVDCRFNCRGF
jgi:hypothetical protein